MIRCTAFRSDGQIREQIAQHDEEPVTAFMGMSECLYGGGVVKDLSPTKIVLSWFSFAGDDVVTEIVLDGPENQMEFLARVARHHQELVEDTEALRAAISFVSFLTGPMIQSFLGREQDASDERAIAGTIRPNLALMRAVSVSTDSPLTLRPNSSDEFAFACFVHYTHDPPISLRKAILMARSVLRMSERDGLPKKASPKGKSKRRIRRGKKR